LSHPVVKHPSNVRGAILGMTRYKVVAAAIRAVGALPVLRQTLIPVTPDAVPITVQLLVTRIICKVFLKKSQVCGAVEDFNSLSRD